MRIIIVLILLAFCGCSKNDITHEDRYSSLPKGCIIEKTQINFYTKEEVEYLKEALTKEIDIVRISYVEFKLKSNEQSNEKMVIDYAFKNGSNVIDNMTYTFDEKGQKTFVSALFYRIQYKNGEAVLSEKLKEKLKGKHIINKDQ